MSGPRVSLLLILFWCTCGLKENLDHDDKKVVFWSTKHLQSFFKGLSFLSSLTSEQGGRSTMCILSQKFHVFWPLDTWHGLESIGQSSFFFPPIHWPYWFFIFLADNFFRPLTLSRWRQIGMNTPHFYASREFPKEPELQNEIASTSIILLLKKKVMDTQIFFQKKKKPKYVTILLHVVNSILGNHAQRKELDSIWQKNK